MRYAALGANSGANFPPQTTSAFKQLYYDTVCFEEGYIRYAVEVVGANKLVLGSDGPFPLGEPDPVRFIERSFGDDPVVAGIFHDNAARMFNASGGEGNQQTLDSPS